MPGYCQHCGRESTLAPVGSRHWKSKDVVGKLDDVTYAFGVRRCSSADCGALTFVAFTETRQGGGTGEVGEVWQWPGRQYRPDTEFLPNVVAEAFVEAAQCINHGLWNAAASMIRRTVEHFCDDQEIPRRTDSGKWISLESRINKLKENRLIPNELIDEFHELRLFGNRGTHDSIDSATVLVAADALGEIMRPAYRFPQTMEALRNLREHHESEAPETKVEKEEA